jgi:hypothetical protein
MARLDDPKRPDVEEAEIAIRAISSVVAADEVLVDLSCILRNFDVSNLRKQANVAHRENSP